MSAGKFETSRYEAEWSTSPAFIHPIRVQPETLAADIGGTTNAAATTGTLCPISAKVSSNKRQFGLIPRTVTLKAPSENPPTGYEPDGITVIPALTTAFYNAAARGVSVAYLGATFTVVSRSPERAQ